MKRIFIATLGTAPAVVTETLWSLAQRPTPWIPDRIEIITTLEGVKFIRPTLMRKDGPLSTIPGLPQETPLSLFVPIRDLTSERIRAVELRWTGEGVTTIGEDPAALHDVDDEEAASCMGDLILDRVHAACADSTNQLHLSISGGRKTMSAHALFSLGLVGNPQDEASHVLMGAEFESNREFWHPDQGGLIRTSAEQNAMFKAGLMPGDPAAPKPSLDPKLARQTLRLFSIAAPRYDVIPKAAPAKAKSIQSRLPRLSVIIQQMNLAGDWRRAPQMELNTWTNRVTINGCERFLDPMDFVWLRLLATAASEGWISPRDHGQPPGAVTVARVLFGGQDRLGDLRRWCMEATTAGTRGNDVVRLAALRTEAMDGEAEGGLGQQNLANRILEWKKEFGKAAVAEELQETLQRNISKLEDHLEGKFGLPLAKALEMGSKGRRKPVDRIPQAAYGLSHAQKGFLKVIEG